MEDHGTRNRRLNLGGYFSLFFFTFLLSLYALLKLPHLETPLAQEVLDLLHRVLAAVEHARAERGVGRGLGEDLLKVRRAARAAGRDDGDADGGLDLADELEVEAAVGAVAVDAVEQDLAGAHGLDGLRELDDVHVARLAAALDGAGVPAVLLALGAGRPGPDDVVPRRVWLGHVDALRVDGDDDGLVAVRLGDLLDGRVAKEPAAGGVVLLRGEDGVGADRDLVGAGLEVHGGDLEGRDLGAVRVDRVADAAADGQGHEDGLGGAAEDLEHGRVGERAVAEAGDVEERDLVGALLVVAPRHLDGLAEVAHVAALALVAHVVLVALCDDEVALVVCAHVEAGDDAARQAVAEGGRRLVRDGGRGVGGQGGGAGAVEEGAEAAQAGGARLLRVELGGEDVAAGEGADKGLAAVGARGDGPALGLEVSRGVGVLVGVDVVVLGVRAEVVEARAGGVGAVPADVGDGLVGGVEAAEAALCEAEAGDLGVLGGALEDGLQADADAHEGLARGDVGGDGGEEAGLGELGEAVAEVADARQDQFLARVPWLVLGDGFGAR
ncbi:hypothetical protein CTA2_11724 [Colletotrichum tanaceti]|uniref:Uncharacterized protein n=1 Tax=Colletotrichum tanaceti TaxID=1306861 RepID=A0A4U6X1V5_9PEZI|nr:hypothetical protein CTA2_11724 [Colletotrichum tanaceti]TKW49348.1 hypothetical protein CTA1_9017 [Colletotrichum tanaceti]